MSAVPRLVDNTGDGGELRKTRGYAPHHWVASRSMSEPVRQPGVWPQPEANPPATALGPRNGLGTASLVLGLLALISSWLMIGLAVGIAAVVTGLLARPGWREAKRATGGW